MPHRRFLLWDLLGTAVWLTALTLLGILFSESITTLLTSSSRMVRIGLWIVLAAAVVFIVYKLWRWLRVTRTH